MAAALCTVCCNAALRPVTSAIHRLDTGLCQLAAQRMLSVLKHQRTYIMLLDTMPVSGRAVLEFDLQPFFQQNKLLFI